MASSYTVYLYENHGSILENDAVEIVRLVHSKGLSPEVFFELVHQAYHLIDDRKKNQDPDVGEGIEIRITPGVIFECEGDECPYAG